LRHSERFSREWVEMKGGISVAVLVGAFAMPLAAVGENFKELAKGAIPFVAVKENPRLFLGRLAKAEGEVLGVVLRPDGSVAFLLRDDLSGAVVYVEGRLPKGKRVEAKKRVMVVGEVRMDERSLSPWLLLKAVEERPPPSPKPASVVPEPKEGPKVTPLEPAVLLPPMPIKGFEIVPKKKERPRALAPPSSGVPSRISAKRGRSMSRGRVRPRSALQRWVASWKPSTKRVIRFFNPGLSDALVERIANALLVASYKHNVDPRLVAAVVAAESRFNPWAVSPKGAMGLGQIMPQNAAALGIDPFNIEQNLDATAFYLRKYLDMYSGRPDQLQLALAAYNAGPNAVAKYKGIPPYQETQNYVRLVLYYYRCLRGER